MIKMMNVIKMFATMIKGLFSYRKFEDKEEFWDWYWEQTPDARYKGESLYECWNSFISVITLGHIRFNVQMWWESRFNRKNFGYCHTFGKNGYFIKGNKWFVPCDKSFSYGCVDTMTELRKGNPLFVKS